MKKVLLVTTVSGFIPQFELNNVRILQNMGYEVHYAANYHTPSYGNDNHRLDGIGIVRHQIDFVRSPFKAQNLTVYRQLSHLMKQEHFDLVHCHTPMGGVMARLTAHATHTAPVVYTAHGFHFYHGAPLLNWLCYYPMERFLSLFTDQQICINQEDYELARKNFHAKHVDYIPGVGIDLTCIPDFTNAEIQQKKESLGLPTDKIIILSSGEMIKRKNHETAIRAIAKLPEQYPIHYIICGHGKLNEYLHQLVQTLHLENKVTFLGYREDMLEILQIADLFLFPSYQEGLPMSLLEAMASGLPILCSDIRGSRDLMGPVLKELPNYKQCAGGIMIKQADNTKGYVQALQQLLDSASTLKDLGQQNALRSKDFSLQTVSHIMQGIYQRLLL